MFRTAKSRAITTLIVGILMLIVATFLAFGLELLVILIVFMILGGIGAAILVIAWIERGE